MQNSHSKIYLYVNTGYLKVVELLAIFIVSFLLLSTFYSFVKLLPEKREKEKRCKFNKDTTYFHYS